MLPPVTSEREITAGPILDVPHICNNGCGGLPQPISPRRCVWELAAAWVSGPDKQSRGGPGAVVVRQSSAICWKPGERGAVAAVCAHPEAFHPRPECGPRSLLDGPGVSSRGSGA